MRITKRDIEMMRFINDFGFCITPHLERRFGMKRWRVYEVMKRLVKAGYVKQQRKFIDEPNLYYLTREGAEFSDLPEIDRINFGIYEHQINVIHVGIKLLELFPAATWTSERTLKYDKFYKGVGVRGHFSDGLLVFPDNKQIAIEVELTSKSIHRLEQILKGYSVQLAYKEVWYFCSPSVVPKLTDLIAKKPHIKIYQLKEFLHESTKSL